MMNIVLLTFECIFTAVKTVTQILLLFLYRVSQRKQVGLAWIPLQNIKLVDYGILYRIFYIESTKFQVMLLQTDINEFSFFNTCFEFRQRFRQVSVFYGPSAGSRTTGIPIIFYQMRKKMFLENQSNYCFLINERFPCKSIFYFLC